MTASPEILKRDGVIGAFGIRTPAATGASF
jgi:hypothetical protein